MILSSIQEWNPLGRVKSKRADQREGMPVCEGDGTAVRAALPKGFHRVRGRGAESVNELPRAYP